MNQQKNILAIESSCDETAAAVLSFELSNLSKNKTTFPKITTLSSVVKSQIKLHSKMGGVVPEVAARAHVKNIRPVVEHALKASNTNLENIDYVAVTAGPGLIPSLIVGVEFAKTLSFALNKPIIPVNHMLGHLYSPFGKLSAVSSQQSAELFPNISLIVSGGHTMLVLMKNFSEYKVIGQTVDDAVGEAFDKVAKLLKLPYPGGPEVSKLAEQGDPNAIVFPRPMLNSKNYDFSFSGLKTAVLYYMRDNVGNGFKPFPTKIKADICASFQEAAVDVLVQKTFRAVKEFKAKSVSLSGGVSANKKLREELNLKSKALNLKFLPSPLSLSGDNAEMIGIAGATMLYFGYKPKKYSQVKADSTLEL